MNKSAFALVLTLLTQPVWADNGGTALDQIAAIVNSDVIMMSEAQKRANIMQSSSKSAANLAPGNLLKQAVDSLILENLQVQKAETAGIQIDDITLNKTIAGIAEQNKLNLADFQQALQEEGIDYTEFREQTRRKLMADALRKREIQSRIKTTDPKAANAQAEEYYQTWLQELRNDAYVEYRIPVPASNLTLQ
ncbi:SurA N-terminal domain-containing protein [Thiothrix lacustris]|uniref:SurA N-terminal domain-containing protein n=1 Tax=Thiothrix lacustris TaxID=525917 RepID=A0ABY9MQR0_9GAMM|nr:SurA N-terminal domain-containing protein [Thiothrix lacustris]WML90888.1 SurA N-terminal domain-containing protein [Thiothrix lacustris]